MASRAIVVDDSSSRINYEGGSWFEDQGSQDQAGNFGPPFRSTLHGTQSSASFSFSFSGTSVEVIGSNNLRNDSGVLDPKWECFVDHISIGATEPFPFAENNWSFCRQTQLVDGPHTLTVNATVAKKQTFWFDRIHYTPSPTASTEQQLVFVDSLDPELKFGSGWGALGGTANMTNKKGTTFEYEFTGVSLSWFSFIPEEFPGKSTTGTYAVDGGSPQAFNLKGHGDKAITVYNQKFFETPTLPMGRHKLVVVYNGDGDTTPLTLDYLIVQNGTASSSSSGSGSDTSPSNTDANIGKKTNIGAIVGGVVSAIAVIILLLLAFFFFRRRKQRRQSKKHSLDLREGDPQASQVHPFQYQPVQYTTSPPLSPSRGNVGWDASDTQSAQYTTSYYGGIAPTSVSHHRFNPSGGSRVDLHSTSGAESSRSPSSPPPQPVMSGKAREAMSQRGQSQVYSDVNSTRVLRHEDSGMRMRDDNPEEVVELPPQYTAG